MFLAGRQLPHLLSLNIHWVRLPSSDYAATPAPGFSRLVSCCPHLQLLDIRGLQYSAELLAPLQDLSSLHTLYLAPPEPVDKTLAAVGQLTGLQMLYLHLIVQPQGVCLLPLTQLKQLTALRYYRKETGWDDDVVKITSEVSDV
jgi:hypothetical protein